MTDVRGQHPYTKALTVLKMVIDPVAPFMRTSGNGSQAPVTPDLSGKTLDGVWNPAAIVIQDPNSIDSGELAHITLTDVVPGGTHVPTSKILWKVTSGASGGQVAFADEPNPAGPGHGMDMTVYGTQPGPVVLTAYLDVGEGRAPQKIDTFEALVTTLRKIPYRAEIYSGPNPIGPTPEEVQHQIGVANEFLFQMGVKLEPDVNPDIAAGFTKIADGIYTTDDVDGLTTSVSTFADKDKIVAQNAYTSGALSALQICYIGDLYDSGGDELLGQYIGGPDTPVKNPQPALGTHQKISLAYRADLGDVPAGGDKPETVHTMAVQTKGRRSWSPDAKANWGLLVSDFNSDNGLGDPQGKNDPQLQYATTLAHEVGHFLGLLHRGVARTQPKPTDIWSESHSMWDGVAQPTDVRNLMQITVDKDGNPISPAPQRDDFDLIQSYFVHGLL